MAGLNSFFRSESFSDTKLVLLLTRPDTPHSVTTPTASASASCGGPSTLPKRKPPGSGGRKRKASTASKDDEEDADAALCIPAHRMILMAKSAYFNTLLSAAGISKATSVIREQAACMEEVRAMEAVVEFMYTEKLSLDCIVGAVANSVDASASQLSPTRRILSILAVAERWQVLSCLRACSRAICTQSPMGMTWDDCYTLFNLPESVQGQLGGSRLFDFSVTLATSLANTPALTPVSEHRLALSNQLSKLPIHARLALLQGCKLAFTPMYILLGSDEQIADSEDSLAVIIVRHIKAVAKTALPGEIRMLKDQLRHQHLSNTFLAFELPAIKELCLSSAPALNSLIHLRGLKGVEFIPTAQRQPDTPAAWYKPARTQSVIPPDSIDITWKLPVTELLVHMKAAALLGSTFAPVQSWTSAAVEFKGVKWTLRLESDSHDRLMFLAVHRVFKNPAMLTCKPGVYVKVTMRIDSAVPAFTYRMRPFWVAHNGMGLDAFFEAASESNNRTDLSWWKDFILDGHVHFSATITYIE